MPGSTTIVLQNYLDRWRDGDEQARDELIARSCERLRRLTRTILHANFARVRAAEETDDVLQTALLRLMSALKVSPPDTVVAYFRLAALQIRRVLLDLIRHHFGPHGDAARQQPLPPPPGSGPGWEEAAPAAGPEGVAMWREFLDRVDALPPDELEVVDLLYFEKLTQPKAAELLGVPLITVRRRWMAARVRLSTAFPDGPPVD